jgi:hypothetical protein
MLNLVHSERYFQNNFHILQHLPRLIWKDNAWRLGNLIHSTSGIQTASFLIKPEMAYREMSKDDNRRLKLMSQRKKNYQAIKMWTKSKLTLTWTIPRKFTNLVSHFYISVFRPNPVTYTGIKDVKSDDF